MLLLRSSSHSARALGFSWLLLATTSSITTATSEYVGCRAELRNGVVDRQSKEGNGLNPVWTHTMRALPLRGITRPWPFIAGIVPIPAVFTQVSQGLRESPGYFCFVSPG